jgi:hypothetical protein
MHTQSTMLYEACRVLSGSPLRHNNHTLADKDAAGALTTLIRRVKTPLATRLFDKTRNRLAVTVHSSTLRLEFLRSTHWLARSRSSSPKCCTKIAMLNEPRVPRSRILVRILGHSRAAQQSRMAPCKRLTYYEEVRKQVRFLKMHRGPARPHETTRRTMVAPRSTKNLESPIFSAHATSLGQSRWGEKLSCARLNLAQ